MQNFKRTSAFVHAVLPYAIRPVWLIVLLVRLFHKVSDARGRPRRVLLVCNNSVAADHLKPITELLSDRRRYLLFVTNDHFPSQEIGAQQIRQAVRASYLQVLTCLFMNWDLIIFVNHPWGFGAWFAPFLKKLYINHGLHAGKINNSLGEDGVYGPHRTTRPHRGLLYGRMFAASSFEREAALASDPGLEKVVKVTGSLMADRILRTSLRRGDIRSNFGFGKSDYVIHVISTWGTSSLMAKFGEELLDELVRTKRISRVLLSLHPRLDKFGGLPLSRSLILQRWKSEGAIVDEKNALWQDFLVASDVAIADHSSLALYNRILDKPVLLVPVERSAYMVDSTFDRMSRNFPILESVTALSSMLKHVQDCYLSPGEFQHEYIVEYLGSAGERHVEEIEKFLSE